MIARLPWAPPRVRAAYAALVLVLMAYLVSLLARHGGQSWAWLDGWGVDAFELSASALCLLRVRGPHARRSVALSLGLALLAWSLGDVMVSLESVGGHLPPTPSPADALYLTFYPLTYTALVLSMRREVGRLAPTAWLDGLVAGLGAAALCAAFAFHSLVHAVAGGPTAVATNLAYPTGDVLLLALVVGGTAVLPGRGRSPWLLLATACAVNAVGDTANLFGSSVGATHLGTVANAGAWPVAILLMSAAVWVRARPADLLSPPSTRGFALPGAAAVAGLSILVVDTVHPTGAVALGLAVATLVTVGVRLTVSAHALRELTERRHHQAVTDELTGLGNRRQLFQVLDGFFADETDPRTLAFLFIDLNRFKEVNDSFGHHAGDELLRQIGPRLEGALRPGDILVRLGGDEFAAVLADADASVAAGVARRLVSRLSEPFVLGTIRVQISASIGIALAPGDATTSTDLLHCADLAMYRAKLDDAVIEVYREQVDGSGHGMRLVEELRTAVEQDGFVLHYQPQVDLRTGRVCAVEALLRWPHPRLGLIPPLEFLPLAEEAGLMRPLTALVLDKALSQCAAWHADGQQLAVAVNISTTNLLETGFVDTVRHALARHRLSPDSLVLEITETTIISDFERSKRVIEELRELGLVVSIDDFGAGFTSLAYLGSLAVRELKLDRTFITGLDGEPAGRDLALVRATIQLGHALGLRVVAEGIESTATLDLLAELGCDLAQGYVISRPVPAPELELPTPPVQAVQAVRAPEAPQAVQAPEAPEAPLPWPRPHPGDRPAPLPNT